MSKDLLKVFGSLVLKKYLGKPVELRGEEYLTYYDLAISIPVVRRNIIDLGGLGFSLPELPVRRVRVRGVRVVLRL